MADDSKQLISVASQSTIDKTILTKVVELMNAAELTTARGAEKKAAVLAEIGIFFGDDALLPASIIIDTIAMTRKLGIDISKINASKCCRCM